MPLEMRHCWSCGTRYPVIDRHCPECGADSQKAPRSTLIGTPSTQTVVPQSFADSQLTTIAAAGVILAAIAGIIFWFWVTIGLLGLVSEPEIPVLHFLGEGTYLSKGRVIIATLSALVLTALSWTGAYKANE